MKYEQSSRICGWITAVSQLTVAACVLYVGYLTSHHVEDMSKSWERTASAIEKMDSSIQHMNVSVHSIDQRMREMNQRVGGVQRSMSPWRMMMP